MLISPETLPPVTNAAPLQTAVRRSASAVLLAAIAAGLASFFLLAGTPSRYAAETTIATDANPKEASEETRSIDAHVRGLAAPDLLLSVAHEINLPSALPVRSAGGWLGGVQKLLLPARWTDQAAEIPRTGEEGVLAEILRRLDITKQPDGTIKVRFEFEQPDVAIGFVDRLFEIYATRQRQNAYDRALLSKLQALRFEVDQAEGAVEQQRHRLQQAQDDREDSKSIDGRFAEAGSELAKAEEWLAAISSRLTAAEAVTVANAINNPDIAKQPAMGPLLQRQIRVARQLGEVAAGTRSRAQEKQLKAELKSLRQQIEAEIASHVRQLERDQAAAIESVGSLRDRLADLDRRAEAARQLERAFATALAAAQAKRTELEAVAQRLQTQGEEALNRSGLLRVASPVAVSATPVQHRRAPPALSVMALTMLLGVGFAVGREAVAQAARDRNGKIKSTAAAVVAAAADSIQTLGADGVATVRSIRAIANLLLARSEGRSGFRTLVASEIPGGCVDDEALQLVTAFGRAGRRVVLVNWDLEGSDLPRSGGPSRLLGLNDLLVGGAAFEDVIKARDGKGVHAIEAGAAVKDKPAALNPDRLNIVFDALDEVYDHVVITARHEEARGLFAAMEGRFDACVSIAGAETHSGSLTAAADLFLGFEVTGIDVIRLDRPADREKRAPRLPFGRARAA